LACESKTVLCVLATYNINKKLRYPGDSLHDDKFSNSGRLANPRVRNSKYDLCKFYFTYKFVNVWNTIPVMSGLDNSNRGAFNQMILIVITIRRLCQNISQDAAKRLCSSALLKILLSLVHSRSIEFTWVSRA